jgi:hypothetical protein
VEGGCVDVLSGQRSILDAELRLMRSRQVNEYQSSGPTRYGGRLVREKSSEELFLEAESPQ